MRLLRPAKKMTDAPAMSTRIEVPRSGCFTMRPTGTAMMMKAVRWSQLQTFSPLTL